MADFFEAIALSEGDRERLCRDLLAEFGVTRIRHNAKKGELTHSCCLPFGRHRNGDRNPSAGLNYRKLTYKCLGCGGKGGLLWFIAVCRGEDGLQARQWLGEQTGIGQTVMDLQVLLKAIDELYERKSAAVVEIPAFPAAILDPWEGIHPYMTTGAPEYGIKGRGIPEATMEHFRVGYAEDYFMGQYEPSQERIVIPHFWRGELVGWQARRINDGDKPKYKSSVDFPKDTTLFNFDPADPGRIVLVESPTTVLRHWHHQPTMTASFGKDITETQLRHLRRAGRVTLWPDPDEAGWNATEQLIELLPQHTDFRIVDSPYDVDPADLPDHIVDSYIETAPPWGVWKRPIELREWSTVG